MKRTASELSALMRLLDEVLELPESSRHSWLKSLSEADAAFAPSLEQLLLSHSPSTTGDVANLEHRIADFVRDELNGLQFDPQLPSARVGPYMLERQIGEGGMGSVWLAQRADGAFTLQVALKLPHATWQGQLAERMSRERDILAALQHENIARFLDAGFDAAGRPFLAMEYIEGVPLDVYCATHRVALIDRLQLTLQVAEALTYAHSKLVIHRDLKPNNILVTKDGRVKLLDFGVATLLAQDGTDKTRLTHITGRALTIDYASPEHIRGELVGTATDVYSMAVVLYELLTGCKPYRLKYGTASEIERAIAETDPRPASDVAADPALKRQLRGDLDAILNKAMKKSPTERYASIAAFAEDIKRHLNDIPVLARPDHIVYKSRKFIARHMLPLSVASLILICLLAGGALVLRQARIARTQALRAEAVQQFLLSIFESNSRDQSDPLRAQRTTARELLDIGAARLHDTSGAALPKESRDQLRSAISALYDQLGLSAQAAAVGVELVDSLRARGRDAEVELANALISLAAAEQQTNQFYAALPLLREAESISARHPSDERLAGYVSSYLANQLTPTDESVRYAERAVTLLRRAEPRGDEMLGALLMIASTKRYSDPNAAESAANEALQLVAATHGPQHQLYAETALTLADIQSARMEEAADATFRKADDIAQKVTEAGHYLRIQTDLRYGLALAEHDQADAAGLRLRRALDAAVQVDGPDDPIYVAWAHEFLARAEWRRGKLDAARREIDAALRIYRKRKPDDVLAKVAELAFDIALAQGRNADAQKLLDEARSGRTNSGMIRVSGFHEAVASREAWLDLENGDAARAAPAFKAIADTQVPPVQRFLENKIGARVGLARALRELRDTDSATAAARRALAELDELGNPVPLRPIAVLAWVEVAADEQAAGDCASAHQAALQAATLMAASADSESFRHKWLIDLAACK